MHSRAAGESATRGGATAALGSVRMEASVNSLVPGGKWTAEALTCHNSERGARLTTNSPVASILRSVSLRVSEVNCTIPGSEEATVKNEWGARLVMPLRSTVETQAIGRGITRAVSSR